MFYLLTQNSETVFLSISSQKMHGCSVYFGKVNNLCTLPSEGTASVNMDSNGDSTIRDKDKALLLFPVYYPNLYFCHLLSCLGTYSFFKGNPYENMTMLQ